MFGFIKDIISPNREKLSKDVVEGAYLVDVRTPAEFASGSVPGAVNIPVSDIGRYLKNLSEKKSVVVFCRSGARSEQAKSILKRNGIQGVINGGSWQTVDAALRKTD